MSLSLVRSERRFERFDETFLSARAEVRILVRALLGEMPELSLHCLDRRAACDRLARHRMPTHLVVAEQTESELALFESDFHPAGMQRRFARLRLHTIDIALRA